MVCMRSSVATNVIWQKIENFIKIFQFYYGIQIYIKFFENMASRWCEYKFIVELMHILHYTNQINHYDNSYFWKQMHLPETFPVEIDVKFKRKWGFSFVKLKNAIIIVLICHHLYQLYTSSCVETMILWYKYTLHNLLIFWRY